MIKKEARVVRNNDGQLTVIYTETKKETKKETKNNFIKAKDLKQGEEFIYSGREFVALGLEQHGILAVAKKPLEDMAFDDGGSNDWRKSSIRNYLNGEFIKEELDHSGLMKFTSDLTADDGMTDYGISVDFVFLLSADLYRKYRYQMPKWSTWVWLITPWSCHKSNCNCERSVYTDGSLYNLNVRFGHEVMVACLINPEFFVSSKREPRITNLEKIRQAINEMDEADVAKWIYDNLPDGRDSTLKCIFCTEEYHDCDNKCERHIQKWLKQEVNEDGKIR